MEPIQPLLLPGGYSAETGDLLTVSLTLCEKGCGAAVLDPEAHNDWHDANLVRHLGNLAEHSRTYRTAPVDLTALGQGDDV